MPNMNTLKKDTAKAFEGALKDAGLVCHIRQGLGDRIEADEVLTDIATSTLSNLVTTNMRRYFRRKGVNVDIFPEGINDNVHFVVRFSGLTSRPKVMFGLSISF